MIVHEEALIERGFTQTEAEQILKKYKSEVSFAFLAGANRSDIISTLVTKGNKLVKSDVGIYRVVLSDLNTKQCRVIDDLEAISDAEARYFAEQIALPTEEIREITVQS